MKIIRNLTCRMCDCADFNTVIDLGEHPLVNSLVSKDKLSQADPVFPLVVKQCRKCSLVQLVDIIDSEEIYKNVDYLFFSSDMPGLDRYFRPYAADIHERFLWDGDMVVEIGSNDGIMLDIFRKTNPRIKILGVDPATNVVLRALKRGIPTVPLFFSEELAKKIKFEWGPAKVVMGNNCIAHLNDLRDLIKGARLLLADNGVFAIECNYWGGMVKNVNYSLIYHDHYSFFTVKVWQRFAAEYEMRVFDALVTPAQGGSLRMFLCKDDRSATGRLLELEREEERTLLNNYMPTSQAYRDSVRMVANKFYYTVDQLKKQGKMIAGYGAAAKGFTILKFSKVGAGHIDYFVDDSPAKQGWFTPVDHIPIITRAEAERRLPDYFIILAPNYADVIIEKEKDSEFRRKGGKFIVPVGDIKII